MNEEKRSGQDRRSNWLDSIKTQEWSKLLDDLIHLRNELMIYKEPINQELFNKVIDKVNKLANPWKFL